MTTPGSSALAAAFIRACTLDVTTLKPGNVSQDSPGHRMTAVQFIASAEAAAPVLCASGSRVGRRILDAVHATRKVADCNTNLGIILLCAPIAAAAERQVGTAQVDPAGARRSAAQAGMTHAETVLRRRLREVMAALTIADADDAFRAIALANPGGLGTVKEHDVHAAATVDLRAAMALAGERDLVARQYANDGADLFDIGLGAWRAEVDARHHRGEDAAPLAMQRVYLEFLACFPDSHIARKHGLEAAQAVSRQAQGWRRRRLADAEGVQADLAKWDAQLKAAGLNPGTSADLAVATAFLAATLGILSS